MAACVDSCANRRFGIRVAVCDDCQLSCMYCPRGSSMESFTPREYRRHLKHTAFIDMLVKLLGTFACSSVSLTGGEPLQNSKLREIAGAIRPIVPKLELNTNGLLLDHETWRAFAGMFDLVKVSLDTLSPTVLRSMTKSQDPGGHIARVVRAIDIIRDSGDAVALNCVVTRLNLTGLFDLIDWGVSRGIRIHLLDFYFTEERREEWLRWFVPLEEVASALEERYGSFEVEDMFGCDFKQVRLKNGAVLRMKSSCGGTMRSKRCQSCDSFCQEGVYGLKMSTQGWVTYCPSNDPSKGFSMIENSPGDQWESALMSSVEEIASAEYDPVSFNKMIAKNRLSSMAGSTLVDA